MIIFYLLAVLVVLALAGLILALDRSSTVVEFGYQDNPARRRT